MMFIRILISFLIFTFVQLPAAILAVPCLAIMLLTKWDGRSYFFGNSKWGRATEHYLVPTKGSYWRELSWMGFRNPVYNLGRHILSKPMKPYAYVGDAYIGDKIKGGFYEVIMDGGAWEFYWVAPYANKTKCVRVRVGWKIMGNDTERAEFVFMVNPWKTYSGI